MAKAKQSRPIPDVEKMFLLAEQYSEASKLLEPQAQTQEWGCHGPHVLVDSFATELYLKCLYVLDRKAAPPPKHDWSVMFDALEPHTKITIRKAFEEFVKSKPILKHIKNINPAAEKTVDFNRSFNAAKDTFDKRRYLFETMPQTEWFYTGFICGAVRSVVILDFTIAVLLSKKSSTSSSP